MKRQHNGLLGRLFLAALLCGALKTQAQDQRGDWSMAGGDVAQSGWQKGEIALTPDNAAAQFKYLWRFSLGQPTAGPRTFNEPLLIGRVINGQGFKDIVFSTSADTLYAVDSELGSLIWKKQFNPVTASTSCTASNLSMLMEPPIVINFQARRRRPPGTPRPPDPPLVEAKQRRIGVAPGGGYFGFKGIYVITADGMLHEQIVTTGADFGPPVKFLPASNARPYGLNFDDKVLYTATGTDCGGAPNGEWAIDLKPADYPVTSFDTHNVHPISTTGPVMTSDGTSILITGQGNADSKPDDHPGSVVAITKDLKLRDWFTPKGGITSIDSIAPILVEHEGKQLVVAPGHDGTLVLLDLASLGGPDHQTPLYQTPALSKPEKTHPWDGLATWTDTAGNTYVFASISAAITLESSAVHRAGATMHGGIIAFKLDDQDDKFALDPLWISSDMLNPAPPRIANGVLVALAGGDPATHAVLHVLNAKTGQDLYTSKDEIPTYTNLSGVAFGDSHAFFTDHDNVLYSFGIALEH